jgi:hypothetical protein
MDRREASTVNSHGRKAVDQVVKESVRPEGPTLHLSVPVLRTSPISSTIIHDLTVAAIHFRSFGPPKSYFDVRSV